jgi:hypothetical protein
MHVFRDVESELLRSTRAHASRIGRTSGGAIDPQVIRRESAYLRYLSICEAYTDTVLVDLEVQVGPAARGVARVADVPDDLAAALAAEPRAKAMFDILTSQNRFALYHRITSLKTEAARARKIEEYVAMLATEWKFSPDGRTLVASGEAVGLHSAAKYSETPLASRADMEEPELRHIPFGNSGEATDRRRDRGCADFRAIPDQADPERRLVLDTALGHFHVALLEDAQRQQPVGIQHRVQREERQPGDGHSWSA